MVNGSRFYEHTHSALASGHTLQMTLSKSFHNIGRNILDDEIWVLSLLCLWSIRKNCIYIYSLFIFLYTCVVWIVRVLVAQSCPTLLPWTVAHQAPLSMESSRQGFWSGLPFPPPVDLPDPGIEPTSLILAGWFFAIWVIREALLYFIAAIFLF